MRGSKTSKEQLTKEPEPKKGEKEKIRPEGNPRPRPDRAMNSLKQRSGPPNTLQWEKQREIWFFPETTIKTTYTVPQSVPQA